MNDDQTLHCTICKTPIAENRAQRHTATCSEKCKNRLDYIRKLQREARKCAYCLHPSTPEEREEFRIWRSERGDRKSAGRQTREHGQATKHEMRQALREAARAIKALLGAFPAPEVPNPTPEPSDALNRPPEVSNGHKFLTANGDLLTPADLEGFMAFTARLKDLYEIPKRESH